MIASPITQPLDRPPNEITNRGGGSSTRCRRFVGTESDSDHDERVRAPPQQCEHQGHTKHERDRSPTSSSRRIPSRTTDGTTTATSTQSGPWAADRPKVRGAHHPIGQGKSSHSSDVPVAEFRHVEAMSVAVRCADGCQKGRLPCRTLGTNWIGLMRSFSRSLSSFDRQLGRA